MSLSRFARGLLPVCAAVFSIAIGAGEGGETSFSQVERQLDKGGSFYFYMDGKDVFSQGESWIELFKACAASEADGQDDAVKALGVVSSLYNASGLKDIDGLGMSSIRTASGLYRNKGSVHCPEGASKGFVWSIYGKAPHGFSALKLLPATTALAIETDFDAKEVWRRIKDALRKDEHFKALEKIASGEALAKAGGFDIDKMLESFDGEFGYLITLDKEQMIRLPMPNAAAPVEFPAPGFAAFMKVKDDSIYEAILAKAPMLKPVEGKGGKVASAFIPLPLPVALQPSLARKGDYMIFATSQALLDSIFAVMDGGPGLASTESFKRLSADTPLNGNAFVYLDRSLMDAFSNVQRVAMMSQGMGDGAAKIYELMGLDMEMFSVMAKGSAGLTWSGNSNKSGASVFLMQGTAPMAIMAGMLLPALNSAREKARRISCASNLKQIGLALKQYSMDHADKFPEKSGAEGLESLRSEDYLTDTRVFVCPTAKAFPAPAGTPLSEATVSYVYLGGFDEDTSPDMPLAFDKPGNHRGFINVLFGDGHVTGYPVAGETCVELMRNLIESGNIPLEAEDAKLLLEKATIADIIIEKGPAATDGQD